MLSSPLHKHALCYTFWTFILIVKYDTITDNILVCYAKNKPESIKNILKDIKFNLHICETPCTESRASLKGCTSSDTLSMQICMRQYNCLMLMKDNVNPIYWYRYIGMYVI